jgi:hypothetical protein
MMYLRSLYMLFLGAALSSSSRQCFVDSLPTGMCCLRRRVVVFLCLSFAFIVSYEVVSKPCLIFCAVCVVALQSTTVWVIWLRYSVFRLNFATTLF